MGKKTGPKPSQLTEGERIAFNDAAKALRDAASWRRQHATTFVNQERQSQEAVAAELDLLADLYAAEAKAK